MKFIFVTLAAFLAMCQCSFCTANELSTSTDGSEWSWVYVQSLADEWDIGSGKAKVQIKGNKFRAELYDSKDINFVLYRLDGEITGDRLTAKLVTQNSDFGESAITGKIKSKMWPKSNFADDSIGRMVITLSDGMNILGLTRELKRDKTRSAQ